MLQCCLIKWLNGGLTLCDVSGALFQQRRLSSHSCETCSLCTHGSVFVCGNLGHSSNDQIIIQLRHKGRRDTSLHTDTHTQTWTKISSCATPCFCGTFVCVCDCTSACLHSCSLPVWDDEVTGPSLLTSQFNLDLHNPSVNFHRVHSSSISRQVMGG